MKYYGGLILGCAIGCILNVVLFVSGCVDRDTTQTERAIPCYQQDCVHRPTVVIYHCCCECDCQSRCCGDKCESECCDKEECGEKCEGLECPTIPPPVDAETLTEK